MANAAMAQGAPNMEAEDDVKRLQSELEALKARLSAVEAMLPKTAVPAASEPVPAETLALIAAAVTAFLGKKVKIRSARLIPTVNQWGQAGRITIQASHNLKR
jgi:hypothetical protein